MGVGKNNPFAGKGLGNIAFSPAGTGSTNSRVSGESQPMRAVRRRQEAGTRRRDPLGATIKAVVFLGCSQRGSLPHESGGTRGDGPNNVLFLG
jgi:hypothetical protein